MGEPVEPDRREAPKLRVVSSNENVESRRLEKPIDDHVVSKTVEPADIYTSLGQCVAQRREERGISQREFAFTLGVKQAQLKNYENGLAIFTPDLLLRAAKILDVQPSQFFVLLAKRRLADLSEEKFPLEPNASVVDEADKIRDALLNTISKCDSIITILDIIAVSRKS